VWVDESAPRPRQVFGFALTALYILVKLSDFCVCTVTTKAPSRGTPG
jgi:hypothetical protein